MGSKSNLFLQLALLVSFILLLPSANVKGAKAKRRAQGTVTIVEYASDVKADDTAASPVVIPGFISLAHKVASGKVIIKDSRTISIKGFTYDGAGPDAYFLVGKGTPTARGRKIANENGSYEVLEGYEGTDIELLLPADLTWKDVDYLAVYCVSFNHNFGYVKIPKGLNVPDYQ